MNYLNGISTKKTIPGYITIKLLEVKDQERLLKAVRERHYIHRKNDPYENILLRNVRDRK